MYPERRGWTLTNQLLAIIADCVRWLQWAKTPDGQRNHGMPDPIPRPGVKSNRQAAHPKGKGLPRSRLHKVLKRKPLDRPERIARLREVFATADRE